jgi:hypothetical protein
VTAQSIVKALKLTGPITDATVKLNSSGRASSLSFLTPVEPATVSATTLRAAVGLRSTWFTLGVLSLTVPAPSTPVTYGSSVTLGGAVRGVSGVTLEQRPLGGQWQPVSTVGAGAVRVSPKPTLTTDYRLATTSAAAGSVRIRVAPAITLSTFDVSLVAGSVQPLLMGATVQVEQQNADRTWTAVGSGALEADGTFSIPVSLVSGTTYRVTVGATGGYAAGSTPPQVVVR